MQTKASKILLLLLLGGGGLYVLERFDIVDLNLLFCARSKYAHINKELACGDSFVVKKHSYADLKKRLGEFIQSEKSEGSLSDVSIYFRDLENGPTMGISEHDMFAPASLLKLPLALTYFQLSEEQPELLEKELTFRTLKKMPLEQTILPKENIEENTPYAVKELLERMIKYSDNNAFFVLSSYLYQYEPNRDLMEETMRSLGIFSSNDVLDEDVSVKSYASIFIQLYNASFFNKKGTSEKVLSILSNTEFKDGIGAGIPANIKLAQKFGERSATNSPIKQLHDCGIVYYPENPYLLCIMTRGSDTNQLQRVISTVSKMVYEEFDSRQL